MTKTECKKFFKGKKITIMGLGLLGRGVGDAVFLAEYGASLIVTDLKTSTELQLSLKKLRMFKNVAFVLGEHRLENFCGRDFILKAAGVPLDSPYIAYARKNGVPIEMDASLFARLMPPGVKIIGVTGTRGKSTTTALIYEILKKSFGPKKVFLGGNIKNTATLPLLLKVKKGDYVVMELDSWQLQGFGEAKISPHVAVFTTFFPDHMNYYKGNLDIYFKDKTNIFSNQKKGDILVVGLQAAERVSSENPPVSPIVARAADLPVGWKVKIPGEHNLANISCAVAAARALRIPLSVIKKNIESFKGLPNRLEYLRTIRGIKIYNDNFATTPEATVAALKALNSKSRIANSKSQKNIILIMGGADKGLDMSGLMAEIPKYCKAVILLPGTGTDKLRIMKHESGIMKREKEIEFIIHNSKFVIHGAIAKNLEAAIKNALAFAQKGDIVLFSPAFASFGMFKNEYDRGEQFVRLVKKL